MIKLKVAFESIGLKNSTIIMRVGWLGIQEKSSKEITRTTTTRKELPKFRKSLNSFSIALLPKSYINKARGNSLCNC